MKTAAFVLAGLLLANPAGAAAIKKGTFALGAERITGMFHDDERIGDAGDSTGRTTFALLGSNGDPGSVADAWQLPRIGLDGFIVDGLSLGGSFVVIHHSFGDTDSTDLLVAPRIGFGFMFGRVVGIWPRGGFSYWHQWADEGRGPNNETKAHSFAFDVDVPFIIEPIHDFGITIGPLFDVSVGGTRSPPVAPSAGTKFTQFGLSFGVVGFL